MGSSDNNLISFAEPSTAPTRIKQDVDMGTVRVNYAFDFPR
jgi:hypothetical protein